MSGDRKRRPTPAYGDVVVRALRPRLRLGTEGGDATERHLRTSKIWRLERPGAPAGDEGSDWHEAATDPMADTVRLPDDED